MFLHTFHWLADRISGGAVNAISRSYEINPRELRFGNDHSQTVLKRRIERRQPMALGKEWRALRELGAPDEFILSMQADRPVQADGAPTGIATMVHNMSRLSMFDSPATIRHAMAMDRVIARSLEPRFRVDLDALIEVYLAEPELQVSDWSWIGPPEEAEAMARASAAPMDLSAEARKRFGAALQAWAWFRLLAHWDQEMASSFWQFSANESKRYLPAGSSFALLLPRSTKVDEETKLAKEWQLPVSRLLDLIWARLRQLAYGRWPARAPRRRGLVAACASWGTGSLERKIKGLRSGEKMIDLLTFMELFTAMREAADLPRMPIPLPWLVTALMWEKVFVTFDQRREHPHCQLVPDLYGYKAVWELERVRTTPMTAQTTSAWPLWLTEP